jgi:hypothetical protein
MKFFVAIILTALLTFVAGLYFQWWSLAISAFLVAVLVHQKPVKAFFAGFLGGFILWGALEMWINSENDGYLAAKVAALLPFGPVWALMLVTAFIGGLVAGSGAITGSFLRSSNKQG